MDDDTTVQCDEIVGLTVQMFGLLKPGGAFGGIFAPGGALSAHPGTYLAAQSTLLGIIPAIGMTKANCVNCTKEVGRPGDGVWWRCKGCRMGRGFICGDCFAKGRKCGGGHTVDSLHHHAHDGGEREVGHVLIRHGHSTGIEDLILGSRRTQSEAGLTSDDVSIKLHYQENLLTCFLVCIGNIPFTPSSEKNPQRSVHHSTISDVRFPWFPGARTSGKARE